MPFEPEKLKYVEQAGACKTVCQLSVARLQLWTTRTSQTGNLVNQGNIVPVSSCLGSTKHSQVLLVGLINRCTDHRVSAQLSKLPSLKHSTVKRSKLPSPGKQFHTRRTSRRAYVALTCPPPAATYISFLLPPSLLLSTSQLKDT
jgi:hypothetical protein